LVRWRGVQRDGEAFEATEVGDNGRIRFGRPGGCGFLAMGRPKAGWRIGIAARLGRAVACEAWNDACGMLWHSERAAMENSRSQAEMKK
jgi:hypothetical protein